MADNPIPQGKYTPAVRAGNLVWTAGMTPRNNGVLIKTGKVKSSDNLDDYRDAVRQAAMNTYNAASNTLADGEAVAQLITFTVYVNCEPDFTSQSKTADYASEYYAEILGEFGVGSRVAVGVASLPGNAPVEIQAVFAIRRTN